MASEIKVDTISEKTSANGVTIDGVSLKDSKVATANSIDSDAYVDGSIDTAHIADNQVTLAKMAGLARGKIIYGDASGDPAALAVGSADQVLTHDGTDLSWEDASGAVTALNNATANELVTVGSTTTELDAESGLTYTDGALVIGGTTPSLTIGDAGAEDTKIVFDGNALDFHIGLDDSADTLLIGKGSALGTTTHMRFDTNGIITKPLQPAFVVTPNANSADISADTLYSIVADTEILDRNGDWDGNTTFTAPVTGIYLLGGVIVVGDYDVDNNGTALQINTSNRYWYIFARNGDKYNSDGTFHISFGMPVDMDAGDTAIFQIHNNQGVQQPFISQEHTFLSGWLLG